MEVKSPKLKADLEALLSETEAELQRAESQVTRLKRLLVGLREVLHTWDEIPSPNHVILFHDLGAPSKPTPNGSRRFADMTIREAVKIILRERGQPMTVREIYEVLVAGGKTIRGNTPREALRSTIRNHEEDFKKTPDAKWALLQPREE